MRIITKQELMPLLKATLKINDPVIVEAGAFNGQDTRRLASCWPAGTVHAFEPVPEIFSLLQHATHNLPQVTCYPYALSTHNGNAIFYLSQKATRPQEPFQAGSLHKPTGRLAWSPIEYPSCTQVNTITLDSWAQRHAINHIDLLWLDVQGHALSIMQAAPVMMATVKLLYLEIEFKEAYENQPTFQEVITWLYAQGFQEIARDFHNQERWFYGNMLFSR